MSLFKKATTFISIFNEVRAKNEAQRQTSTGLNGALKQAERMRVNMNGFSIKPQKKSSYFADHYGCGIHAVETYDDE